MCPVQSPPPRRCRWCWNSSWLLSCQGAPKAFGTINPWQQPILGTYPNREGIRRDLGSPKGEGMEHHICRGQQGVEGISRHRSRNEGYLNHEFQWLLSVWWSRTSRQGRVDHRNGGDNMVNRKSRSFRSHHRAFHSPGDRYQNRQDRSPLGPDAFDASTLLEAPTLHNGIMIKGS